MSKSVVIVLTLDREDQKVETELPVADIGARESGKEAGHE
jgi:hypothetical protein